MRLQRDMLTNTTHSRLSERATTRQRPNLEPLKSGIQRRGFKKKESTGIGRALKAINISPATMAQTQTAPLHTDSIETQDLRLDEPKKKEKSRRPASTETRPPFGDDGLKMRELT